MAAARIEPADTVAPDIALVPEDTALEEADIAPVAEDTAAVDTVELAGIAAADTAAANTAPVHTTVLEHILKQAISSTNDTEKFRSGRMEQTPESAGFIFTRSLLLKRRSESGGGY